MAIRTTAMKNTLATAFGAAATHAALFTADPGSTGAATGEVTGGSYARKAITWGTASNGQVQATVTFDVPAGITIRYAGVAGGASGSNILDAGTVVEQPINTAGTYALTVVFVQS